MIDFVIKGHVCYSETQTNIRVVENGYLVCMEGKCQGVYTELPEEYQTLPIKDYGNRLIIPCINRYSSSVKNVLEICKPRQQPNYF
jgi:hypothetical protein